jgi:hypothetical protein
MRLPSAKVWTLSLTASAENGAPFTTLSDPAEISAITFGMEGAFGAGGGVWPAAATPEHMNITKDGRNFIILLL